MTLSISAEPAPNVGSESSRAWRWEVSRSAIFTSAQSDDIFRLEHQCRCFPVEIEQTLVRRLQQDIGEILPESHGRGITHQALPQCPLGATKIARHHQLSTEEWASVVTVSTIL